MDWRSPLIEIAETLKENTGKDMGNDQNEAASNQPILLEWRILKLGPCSRPGIKVTKEHVQTTGSVMIPTLCPPASLLLLKTGSVELGSSVVRAIKNHLYLINCSAQGSKRTAPLLFPNCFHSPEHMVVCFLLRIQLWSDFEGEG